ncbi:peroxiredoxin-like family protein [Ferrimonas kyonanensis]|uniref:peroxiredoxin-like family protein n=1 Tax=Ferrimonas kyonanensis TaxID=364763 RepID=UPI00047FF26B|nr:peroxiredoxin-like family protein [Ferrimonas kyonanensis]
MSLMKFKAGDRFPVIELPTLGGNPITLGAPQGNADWRLLVVYRGRHCPMCTRYLNEIELRKEQFHKLGIDIAAVSADSHDQAMAHRKELSISYPLAYDLNLSQMRQLGLYVSEPRSAQETDHLFAEPGLYVINDQGKVQVIDISNGPFVRPELDVLLAGLAFIRNPDNHYPIRGTYE